MPRLVTRAPMARLSLRNLRGHVGRYVLTFLAVVIGVGFVAGVVTLTDTIGRTFDDLFSGLNAGTDVAVRGTAQFDIAPQFGGGVARPRVRSDLVERVRRVDGVAAAEGEVQGYARPIGPDGTPYGNPQFGAPTIGTNWGTVPALNPFRLVEGRPPRGPTEVVLDKRTAGRTGYRVGDVMTFQTQQGVGHATLVGIARFGRVDSPAGTAVTLFDDQTAERLLAAPGQVDTVEIAVTPESDPVVVRDAVRRALAGEDLEVVTGDVVVRESQAAARETFGGIRTFLLVFALISVLVGSFVIYTSFSFIVAQRQRQIALLRAIGAGRRQVLSSVVAESFVVGLLAAVVGYGVGVALASTLAGLFVPGARAVVEPRSAAVCLAVGTLVTMASAFVPALRASGVPPVAAMRDVAIDTSHRSALRVTFGLLVLAAGVAALVAPSAGASAARLDPVKVTGAGMVAVLLALIVLGPVVARPVALAIGRALPAVRGIVGRLAQQNAARNPRRTASTASALLIGLGIVSLFLVVNASLRASLDDTVDHRFRGDLVVDSGGTFQGGGLPGAVEQEINALPEVDAASGVRFGLAEIDGRSEAVGALDPRTGFDLFDVKVVAGDVTDLDEDGLAVFADRARREGWHVGDHIPVVFGNTGARPFTVAALLGSRDLTGTFVMGTTAFDANLPQSGDTQIWVRLADGVSVDQGRAAIEPLIAAFPSAQLEDLRQFKDTVEAQYDVLLVLVNALLTLTILIAMIGIVNTLILSVVERTREIGLTRAVGATRGQVRATIRWEALLIAALGLAGALAVGVAFGWVLVRALADQGFSVFALPAGQLALCAALTAVLTLAASVIPAAWAGRRRILAALADR